MGVNNFRDLMLDLEATDPSTDVYVTLWTGWRYHSTLGCDSLDRSENQNICRIPLKLAKWLGYEKPCQHCG